MKPSTQLQYISALLAHFFTIVTFILILIWAGKLSTTEGFLGGFTSTGSDLQKFNLHPVLMTTGMVVLYAEALLSWRTLPVSHMVNKYLHATLQTVAVILSGVGLKHAFQYANSDNGANLYTLHGWIGILAVCLFYTNYLGGLVIFANPYMDGAIKATYVPLHQFLGLFTFVLACCQVLTGIQEENTWSGACEYLVDRHEIDPAMFYYRLTKGCKVSNGLGVIVVLLCMTTIYATTDIMVGRTRKEDKFKVDSPNDAGATMSPFLDDEDDDEIL